MFTNQSHSLESHGKPHANDELESFDADQAVTFIEHSAHSIPKYRAIEAFEHDMGSLSFLGSKHHHHLQEGNNSSKSRYLSLSTLNSDNIKSSTVPLRLALSKTEIPSSASSSSVSNSRCPEKPVFLCNSAFHANESNFEQVKELVEKALSGMSDYDCSYIANDCMWKCKFIQGSHMRELHVSCYWDSKKEDHILEVKRVKGDGLSLCSSSSTDFVSKLKTVVTNSQDIELPMKRGKLRGPLPLLPLTSLRANNLKTGSLACSSSSSSSSSSTSTSVSDYNSISKEDFLKGIHPILTMANDSTYESRIEASKMLCDLATNPEKREFLEVPECFNLCIQSLQRLIGDEFDDIKQFAVMAFASFAELDDSYRKALVGFDNLHEIVSLVKNCPRDVPSYNCAQMRRKAAYAMSLLGRSFPQEAKECLIEEGFESSEKWIHHCNTLLDARTRNYAKELSDCYEQSS